MKRKIEKLMIGVLSFSMLSTIVGCGKSESNLQNIEDTQLESSSGVIEEGDQTLNQLLQDATMIQLSDEQILVGGEVITDDVTQSVHTGNEIIYYQEGKGIAYGAGEEEDEHSAAEAQEHTVVTITEPGSYVLAGKLSKGQIAIDLGEDANEDPDAIVNLILDNVEITNTVAPAIIVYHAYECGSYEEADATKDIDTKDAGFNLYLSDNSTNTITGSHVSKIYKEGTTEEDVNQGNAKKAHKYDGAIESLVSFNINAGEQANGNVIVNADFEGIETKLHMTINGGNIIVNGNDDSLNAGEDNISVITINGGTITCDSGYADGEEGDGIDSNGWIVINGGYVTACANSKSQDSGLDSDLGIHINGGTVLASGNMYDEIAEDSQQAFTFFRFSPKMTEEDIIVMTDENGNAIKAFQAVNDYTIMIYSSDDLVEGTYQLWKTTSVEGTKNGGIYTDIISYGEAIQLQYNTSAEMMGQKDFGNGAQKPTGEAPEQIGRAHV